MIVRTKDRTGGGVISLKRVIHMKKQPDVNNVIITEESSWVFTIRCFPLELSFLIRR